jgi:hypothetical protein
MFYGIKKGNNDNNSSYVINSLPGFVINHYQPGDTVLIAMGQQASFTLSTQYSVRLFLSFFTCS